KMVALLKKAQDEKRSLTAEEEASWTAMDAEFEARVKEIDTEEKDAERRAKLDQREQELRVLDGRQAGREGDAAVFVAGRRTVSPEARARASRVLRAWASQPPGEWNEEVREEIK